MADLELDVDVKKGVVAGIKEDGNLHIQPFGQLTPYDLLILSETMGIMAKEGIQENLKIGATWQSKNNGQTLQGILQTLVKVNAGLKKFMELFKKPKEKKEE